MTRSEAVRAIQRMILMFGGRESWDEATVASWAEQVAKCDDYEAACEATNRLVQTWEQPGRPPFAVWLKTYNVVRQRYIDEQRRPALERGALYREIGASEYLSRLLDRARGGSVTAVTELGNWWRSGFGQPLLNKSELESLGVDTRQAKWDNVTRPAVRALEGGEW